MKILLLSSTNNIRNGYGNVTHELCSFLNGKIDFTLLLPRNEKRYEYTQYPTEYVLPDYIFTMKTPKILDYFMFDYKTRADVIHSLFEFPYALIATRLARTCQKPLLIGTQGTYAIQPLFMWPEKYFVKWMYNSAQVITAPSAFTKDALIRHSGTRTPVQVIHDGVNFDRFQEPHDVSRVRERFAGKKILLTVGGLKPRKGQDIVLRALSKIRRTREDFHYMVVGNGTYRAQLERIVQEEHLQNFVTFAGECDEPELVKYFQACDIYVHTPVLFNWNFEGFGIVYLEASACRKPIIAADAGGVRDAVIENKTGLVVPEGDASATAQAIERLLDDVALRTELGENGYTYAKEHDWSRIGEKFLALYATLI